MNRRQVEFVIMTESIKSSNAPLFTRVTELLKSNQGWEVISSYPMGVDISGGMSGAGAVMMAVSLVRYEYS